MRATKGYVAGVGTTSALIGAIGCAFALLSAMVAVHGWPLELAAPGTSTIEDRGEAVGDALPALDVFPGATGRVARGGAGAESGGRSPRGGVAPAAVRGPFASAFGPAAGGRVHGPVAAREGRATDPATGAHAGSASPPGTAGGASGDGSDPTAPPSTDDPSSPTLGERVTQTGEQLGAAVQGATSQVGAAVGQVSPTVGQTVTQTGQVAGGAVGDATGTVGGVVSGVGATAGTLLGG